MALFENYNFESILFSKNGPNFCRLISSSYLKNIGAEFIGAIIT